MSLPTWFIDWEAYAYAQRIGFVNRYDLLAMLNHKTMHFLQSMLSNRN